MGVVNIGLMPQADAFKRFSIIDDAPIGGLSSSGDEANHPLGMPMAASGANPQKLFPLGKFATAMC